MIELHIMMRDISYSCPRRAKRAALGVRSGPRFAWPMSHLKTKRSEEQTPTVPPLPDEILVKIFCLCLDADNVRTTSRLLAELQRSSARRGRRPPLTGLRRASRESSPSAAEAVLDLAGVCSEWRRVAMLAVSEVKSGWTDEISRLTHMLRRNQSASGAAAESTLTAIVSWSRRVARCIGERYGCRRTERTFFWPMERQPWERPSLENTLFDVSKEEERRKQRREYLPDALLPTACVLVRSTTAVALGHFAGSGTMDLSCVLLVMENKALSKEVGRLFEGKTLFPSVRRMVYSNSRAAFRMCLYSVLRKAEKLMKRQLSPNRRPFDPRFIDSALFNRLLYALLPERTGTPVSTREDWETTLRRRRSLANLQPELHLAADCATLAGQVLSACEAEEGGW